MQLENSRQHSVLKAEKGPQHRQLKAFIGHWRIEGEDNHRQKVTGEDTYEWLDGEFFLVNRFERHVGDNLFKGLGWISYDVEKRGYFSYSISNQGTLKIYEVEISDHLLVLSGETERATIRLSPEGDTLSIFWDECADGRNWHSLCNLRGILQRSRLDE